MTTSDTGAPAQVGGAPPEARRQERHLTKNAGRLVDRRIGGPRGLQTRLDDNKSLNRILFGDYRYIGYFI